MKNSNYIIPNFRPKRGTQKLVLLTLAERKEIERKGLANHIARMFSAFPKGAMVKSHGMYYAYQMTEHGFIVTMGGRNMSRTELTFPNYEDFTDHLFSKHGACELRRLGKMLVQRWLDDRSLKNSKK